MQIIEDSLLRLAEIPRDGPINIHALEKAIEDHVSKEGAVPLPSLDCFMLYEYMDGFPSLPDPPTPRHFSTSMSPSARLPWCCSTFLSLIRLRSPAW